MVVNCYCGLPARYHALGTDANPGRPFRVCPNDEENGGCNFFEFVGAPPCSRCMQMIPGLIRCLDAQRREMGIQGDEIRRLGVVIERERERAEFASFLQEVKDTELVMQAIDKRIEAYAKRTGRGTHR